jgi:glycosyltransferase involved in cell wall biosynthesis
MKEIRKIAMIGNHLPRQCGIATFTTDLNNAIKQVYPESTCFVLPVNDRENGYDYPPEVRFELQEKKLDSYQRAADFLNLSNVDIVCLQHEYGIFGGPSGSYILHLLKELRMPVVTTLHTILRDPTPDQRKVLLQIAEYSDRLVSISRHGVDFLHEIYNVPKRKVDFIPHGIPDVPFMDPNFNKDRFCVEGKLVLMTFGLLSANKGIETVIEALPNIISRHPNTVYLIVGATHPSVLLHEGETYRMSLQRKAEELGVKGHVIFLNTFVALEQLIELISIADLYITPYLNEAQISSGTLAYTVGAGKAVLSTPYWYAQELLAGGRGVLFPFRNPDVLAAEVCRLLDNEAERHAMRKRAYLYGRDMIWPEVAKCYIKSFERAHTEHRFIKPFCPVVKSLQETRGDLPALTLKHLQLLTDDTGILQHAIHTIPNYHEGYCTDDNARALIVSSMASELETDPEPARKLSARYLAFMHYAFNPETGRFRNFMNYQRQWIEEAGSDDSHGRAIWALGTVLGRTASLSWRGVAIKLFDQALPAAIECSSARTWAFSLLGIHEYLRSFEGDRLAYHIRDQLATQLFQAYRDNKTDEWLWFENILSYSNAVLPHALLMSGQWMPNAEMRAAGLEILRWLAEQQRSEDRSAHFVPIGCNGFYPRNAMRARFDQQPLEAQAMVSACLEAYRCTGDESWREEARRAFEWFLGRNDLGLPLYDPVTGGCRDGLQTDRTNENQGAESTLAFLQSLIELKLAENEFQKTDRLSGEPSCA